MNVKKAAYIAAQRGGDSHRSLAIQANEYLTKTNKPYRLKVSGPYVYTVDFDGDRVNVGGKTLSTLRSALRRRVGDDTIRSIWNPTIHRPDHLRFVA